MTTPGMRLLLYHRLNLGDLICASPAIQWFRERHPEAAVRLLTNDFAANVGALLPGIEAVLAYRKFGSSAPPEWRQLLRARAWRADRVIGLSPSEDRRLALRMRLLGASGPQDYSGSRVHAVERLARLFGWHERDPLPAVRLLAPASQGRARDVALWLSARKPSNRPSVAQMLALVGELRRRRPGVVVGVFGLPSETDSRAHVADAAAQAQLAEALAHSGLALETPPLGALLGEFAASASVIAPDGGMAHVAAGFGKPVVALFGDVDPAHWRPWSPRARVLQAPSRRVPDLAPEAIADAWEAAIAGAA